MFIMCQQYAPLICSLRVNKEGRDFPVVQWLGLRASKGSIPGQGTKMPHATRRDQNNNNNKEGNGCILKETQSWGRQALNELSRGRMNPCPGRGLKRQGFQEFPGGLVVRILGFHCCGLGSIPGWVTEIPQASGEAKKKKKKKKKKRSISLFFFGL